LKLSEARVLFKKCQNIGLSGFVVRRHCWKDHPERLFTQMEILNLLLGKGNLRDNKMPSAKPDSFLWHCKDDENRSVQIAVVFNEDGRITAIAISAFRKVEQ